MGSVHVVTDESSEVEQQMFHMTLSEECSDLNASEENINDGEAVSSSGPIVETALEGDDLVCAICLESVALSNMATIRGCDHLYCASCILHWATIKNTNLCPQCKTPFTHLVVYRQLDGTLSDYPIEESVTLLKRTQWFQEYLKKHDQKLDILMSKEAGRNFHSNGPAADVDGHDWDAYMYDYFESQYDDDEVEDFYFSAAAGRARITLGNRRWGENGYVRAGRMQARPVSTPPPGKAGKAAKSTPPPSQAKSSPRPITGHKAGTSSASSSCAGSSSKNHDASPSPLGSSPPGSGRRARRKAKRAAMDVGSSSTGFD